MREQWYKSSYSTASGECVEAARLVSGEHGMRDSKQPELGHLAFASAEWHPFVSSLKAANAVS
ncbi:DUF397 domain-containing protein [Nocardiopsis sp. HUAS JQ3]|uniref:DUF397 domain-containing protein n=1 Tax=Nocardiopsis sp. HUAS JQ3 TaxID=3061629 RepID=UPI0023A98033|nr:DUF397 domain-containing protein [Nocardiopsis sp. HUAS JQ3]WDZ93145.1 DUF397 domain-containing protein [Nocardiopsis sp. HUAS JQ3]